MLEKEIEFQISFWRHYIFHDWLKTTKNFFFEKSEHYLHGVWELKLPSRLLLIAQRRVSIGGRALRQQRVVSLFCLVSSFILSFVLWYSLSVCYIPYSYAFFFFLEKGEGFYCILLKSDVSQTWTCCTKNPQLILFLKIMISSLQYTFFV